MEKIVLISIGKEILSGATVNTNSVFLAKELSDKGYSVIRQITCADSKEEIVSAIKEAFDHADIVISTGGLGPTVDDKTKEVLADFFQKKLVFNQSIFKSLDERFPGHPSLENQATLPEDIELIDNSVGTAYGMIFRDKKTFIALPGVPQEMQVMFETQVFPFLRKNFPIRKRIFVKEIALGLIAEIHIDFHLRKLPKEIMAGIYPAFSFVRVTLSSQNEELLNKHYLLLCKEFKDFLLPKDSKTIEEAVRAAFIEQKKTLIIAESCTGGAISQRLTSLENASMFFLGGFVSYSNEIKHKFLHVSEETLKKHGAVSLQTVTEMAKGALEITDADFAVAVSGIAGPSGGTKDKPVGTVYIAVAQRGMAIDAGRIHAKGDRLGVIYYTTNLALAILCRHIIHQKNYFIK